MTGISTSRDARLPTAPETTMVWQWQIRLFHWSFVASVVTLLITGFNINRPWFTAGTSSDGYLMGWMRFLHFAAAAVFGVAFAWRVYWFFFGNRYARSGVPYVWRGRWWRSLFGQMLAYARYDFSRPDVGHNALAGLSYVVFVIGLGTLQIVTGLALFGESNPGGFCDSWFGWALACFGGSFRTHMWHHLFAWGFVLFVILHVYIVVLDDRQYRNGLLTSMFTGKKRIHRDAHGAIEGDDE